MEVDKNGTWNCSQKQRELIEKIQKENNLDQNALDRSLAKCSARKFRRSTSSRPAGLSTRFWTGTGKELKASTVAGTSVGARKEQPHDCAPILASKQRQPVSQKTANDC
jgi:hypothetical protein